MAKLNFVGKLFDDLSKRTSSMNISIFRIALYFLMEFDMVGVDPSLANAFRRILIAEVISWGKFIVTSHVQVPVRVAGGLLFELLGQSAVLEKLYFTQEYNVDST
ncbi:uncharacterized protein LOC108200695 isoform X2 [Daucus carota subsp. sativus]|uniref:uncharacterized protein LOC108200695 isoform X2 n=1 Tax=Daucus carota subsp. sativus TaxID=79200 RepID=UPI003082DE9D